MANYGPPLLMLGYGLRRRMNGGVRSGSAECDTVKASKVRLAGQARMDLFDV